MMSAGGSTLLIERSLDDALGALGFEIAYVSTLIAVFVPFFWSCPHCHREFVDYAKTTPLELLRGWPRLLHGRCTSCGIAIGTTWRQVVERSLSATAQEGASAVEGDGMFPPGRSCATGEARAVHPRSRDERRRVLPRMLEG